MPDSLYRKPWMKFIAWELCWPDQGAMRNVLRILTPIRGLKALCRLTANGSKWPSFLLSRGDRSWCYWASLAPILNNLNSNQGRWMNSYGLTGREGTLNVHVDQTKFLLYFHRHEWVILSLFGAVIPFVLYLVSKNNMKGTWSDGSHATELLDLLVD